MQINREHVLQALAVADFDVWAAHVRMTPHRRLLNPSTDNPPRQAGVLALLYPESDGLHVVLTKRTDTLRGHSGQVSFPGGQRDAADESYFATALRETCEEIGLCEPIERLGELGTVYIPPSNFQVFPSVGYLPALPPLQPNPDEVASVFTMPLAALFDERVKESEPRTFGGYTLDVPYYRVRGHKVWGATAAMLSEIEGRLRVVLGLQLL